MQARIKWIEGVTFLAESGSGHGTPRPGVTIEHSFSIEELIR